MQTSSIAIYIGKCKPVTQLLNVTHDFVYLQALVLCLLVRAVYAGSLVTLQSFYTKTNCSRGNLVKIHIDPQCRVSNGLCDVRCNGASTRDVRSSKKGYGATFMQLYYRRGNYWINCLLRTRSQQAIFILCVFGDVFLLRKELKISYSCFCHFRSVFSGPSKKNGKKKPRETILIRYEKTLEIVICARDVTSAYWKASFFVVHTDIFNVTLSGHRFKMQ